VWSPPHDPAPGTHRQTVCGLASRAGIGPPQFDENDKGIIGALRPLEINGLSTLYRSGDDFIVPSPVNYGGSERKNLSTIRSGIVGGIVKLFVKTTRQAQHTNRSTLAARRYHSSIHPKRLSEYVVCLLLEDLLQSCSRGRRKKRVEDMCYERRRMLDSSDVVSVTKVLSYERRRMLDSSDVVSVTVCVYYCRTYDKAVCGGGGGQ
jgi:hypothetical protein